MCRVNLHRKFTGFTHSDKETGFLAESANPNQVFKGKTRFLATRASAFKETGFLAESTHHNEVFKGKTRFLATRASAFKETGFLAESTHHNEVFKGKPGFWLPVRSP